MNYASLLRVSAIAGNVSWGMSHKLNEMLTQYSHALSLAGRDESLSLKKTNFDLLYYNLDQWRTINERVKYTTGFGIKARNSFS